MNILSISHDSKRNQTAAAVHLCFLQRGMACTRAKSATHLHAGQQYARRVGNVLPRDVGTRVAGACRASTEIVETCQRLGSAIRIKQLMEIISSLNYFVRVIR